MHAYGTDAEKIRELSFGNDSLSEAFYISPNMIYWACTEEMAVTLEDLLARRHRGLFLNAKETVRIAPSVAELMAEFLGKNKQWVSEQIHVFEEVASAYLIP